MAKELIGGFINIANIATFYRKLRLSRLAVPFVLSALAACTDGAVSFPLETNGQDKLNDNIEVVVLNADNIGNFSSPAKGHTPSTLKNGDRWEYLVGVGDILSVIVFDHPELTLPAGPQRSVAESGFEVGSDGTFTYPYVGSIPATGRSLNEIRLELAQRLSTIIPEPQVDVRMAAYNAQAIVVSGEVRTPNRQPLTAVPLTLVEAINAAGGATEVADLRDVHIQRGGRQYHVDLQGYFAAGLTQNNALLRNGDVVNIPRRRATEAYLLGEVARPNVVDLSQDVVTLTQAIARLGGLQQTRADARGVLVFRTLEDKTRVFQLDTSNPAGLLLGTHFVLEPGDVIYVLRSHLQQWNDTIARLLPTVQATSAVDSIGN